MRILTLGRNAISRAAKGLGSPFQEDERPAKSGPPPPEPSQESAADDSWRLVRAERHLKKREEQVAMLQEKLKESRRRQAAGEQEVSGLRARLRHAMTGERSINSANVVWIFGSGRTGSTWLGSMMGELDGHALWGEPWVGTLFGNFYYVAVDEKKHRAPQFIMGRHRESWLWSIRNFVLDAAVATFPKLGREDYLVIKEPNGSVGAPLMMEAMPESRMVLLARDPRDVVASSLDARRKGGWHFERNKKLRNGEKRTLAEEAPLTFARKRAEGCLQQMGKAKDAFDAHGGRKALVRYEELRMDTLGTMRRMYSELEIEVDWCEPIFPDSAHSQLPAFRTCSASNSTGGRYPRLECNLFWL